MMHKLFLLGGDPRDHHQLRLQQFCHEEVNQRPAGDKTRKTNADVAGRWTKQSRDTPQMALYPAKPNGLKKWIKINWTKRKQFNKKG